MKSVGDGSSFSVSLSECSEVLNGSALGNTMLWRLPVAMVRPGQRFANRITDGLDNLID
jgi:hypothetical protein